MWQLRPSVPTRMIHAHVKGATYNASEKTRLELVSIHASVKGATCPVLGYGLQLVFRSTPP